MHHQSLHRGSHDELTAEAAVGPALAGGAIEHLVLDGPELRRSGEVSLLDIDVAGGAHQRAAALGDDALYVVGEGGLHDAHADRDVEDITPAVGMNIGDLGHGLLSSALGGT